MQCSRCLTSSKNLQNLSAARIAATQSSTNTATCAGWCFQRKKPTYNFIFYEISSNIRFWKARKMFVTVGIYSREGIYQLALQLAPQSDPPKWWKVPKSGPVRKQSSSTIGYPNWPPKWWKVPKSGPVRKQPSSTIGSPKWPPKVMKSAKKWTGS